MNQSHIIDGPRNIRTGTASLPQSATLISLQNADELAVLGGLPGCWIDLKDPTTGSLGCPNHATIERFLQVFDELAADLERAVVPFLSVAIGDFAPEASLAISVQHAARFSMLKIGVPDLEELIANRRRLDYLRQSSEVADRWVLTYYADKYCGSATSWSTLLEFANQCAIRSVLIDTAIKDGRSTLSHLSLESVSEMIREARNQNISVMVAGGLRLADLNPIWQTGAKIVGIRSAICKQETRVNALDPDRLKSLADLWL